jgi:hypothetical protein
VLINSILSRNGVSGNPGAVHIAARSWHWGGTTTARQAAYRALFVPQLHRAAVEDIRLTLNQSQPVGDARFYTKIEKMTGMRREARPRGRPRADAGLGGAAAARRNKPVE